jgi:hypothetical protein
MRQVIGDHDVAAVVGNREVARIDAGADFGDQFEVVDIVLADPAVARGEVNETTFVRILGPAVQREARFETMDRAGCGWR